MFQIFLTVLFIITLAACSPSEADIQEAIAQTEAAKPVVPTVVVQPTETSIPLSEIDLSRYIAHESDLPTGVSLAQIRDEAPGMFKNVPEANQPYISTI